MASQHVTQLRSIGEPARQYLWEIIIPGSLPGGSGGGGNDNQLFTYRAMSTTIPDDAIEPYEHQFKSEKISFAGRNASAKTFDVTFIDATDAFVIKNLKAWSQYCKVNNKVDYTIDVSMRLLGRTEDEPILLTVTLIQCWPESVQAVNLDYASNDPVNVPVTFRFDDTEIS